MPQFLATAPKVWQTIGKVELSKVCPTFLLLLFWDTVAYDKRERLCEMRESRTSIHFPRFAGKTSVVADLVVFAHFVYSCPPHTFILHEKNGRIWLKAILALLQICYEYENKQSMREWFGQDATHLGEQTLALIICNLDAKKPLESLFGQHCDHFGWLPILFFWMITNNCYLEKKSKQ